LGIRIFYWRQAQLIVRALINQLHVLFLHLIKFAAYKNTETTCSKITWRLRCEICRSEKGLPSSMFSASLLASPVASCFFNMFRMKNSFDDYAKGQPLYRMRLDSYQDESWRGSLQHPIRSQGLPQAGFSGGAKFLQAER
jgi:hypothetical protein